MALDLDEHPTRGALDGHEQVSSPILIGHLGQVFHVDVEVARLVDGKGAVLGLGSLRLQRPQVAHPVAAQAAIQPRARDLRVDELAHDRQQIVQRQQQSLAQFHRDDLLRRGQGGPQPMRRVRPVFEARAVLPLEDGHGRHTVAIGQRLDRLVAGGNLGADRRRGTRQLVQSYDHDCTSSDETLPTAYAPRSSSRRMLRASRYPRRLGIM